MTSRIIALRFGTSLFAVASLPAALGCSVVEASDAYEQSTPPQCRDAHTLLAPRSHQAARVCAVPLGSGVPGSGIRFHFMDAVLLGVGLALARAEQDTGRSAEQDRTKR